MASLIISVLLLAALIAAGIAAICGRTVDSRDTAYGLGRLLDAADRRPG